MANKVYTAPETALVFTESSGDATFTPKNVANGAGRVSAQLDRGAGSKAMRYRWEAKFSTQANITPGTAGVQLEVYIITAHHTAADVDSSVGQSDAALSSRNQLLNAKLIGIVVPTGTAAGTGSFVASGIVEIAARYVSVAYWNATGQALVNTDNTHPFRLVPMPDEIQ